MADTEGEVVCATAPICLSDRWRAATPDLRYAGVRGVMRKQVLATAQQLGIEIGERVIRPEDIASASELFLTNAVRGVRPVILSSLAAGRSDRSHGNYCAPWSRFDETKRPRCVECRFALAGRGSCRDLSGHTILAARADRRAQRCDTFYEVSQGAPLNLVLRDLQKRGLLEYPRGLSMWLRITQPGYKLKAGEYELRSGMTPIDIAELLNSGASCCIV